LVVVIVNRGSGKRLGLRQGRCASDAGSRRYFIYDFFAAGGANGMGDRGQFAIPFLAFFGAHILIAPRAMNQYLHLICFLQACKMWNKRRYAYRLFSKT
jgi:hypothetical protein